jgi:hypothetical protein
MVRITGERTRTVRTLQPAAHRPVQQNGHGEGEKQRDGHRHHGKERRIEESQPEERVPGQLHVILQADKRPDRFDEAPVVEAHPGRFEYGDNPDDEIGQADRAQNRQAIGPLGRIPPPL